MVVGRGGGMRLVGKGGGGHGAGGAGGGGVGGEHKARGTGSDFRHAPDLIVRP